MVQLSITSGWHVREGRRDLRFVGISGPSTGFLVLNAKNAIVSGLGLSQLLEGSRAPGFGDRNRSARALIMYLSSTSLNGR
jgi:hypothetical protein